MKPIAVENILARKELYIEMLVGSTCNYKCSYCFPDSNDGAYRWPTDEQSEIFKNNLSYMFDQYLSNGKEEIHLQFSGGEPTLWPKLGEVSDFFKKKYNVRIVVITNGSRSLRYWKQNSKFFDCINFSIHNEECDPNHLIEIMDWIYLNTDTAIVGLAQMDPKNWEKCKDIVDKMSSHPTPWLLNVRPIVDDKTIINYNNEQLKFLEKKVKKLPPNEYKEKMAKSGKVRLKESKIFAIFKDGIRKEVSSLEFYENNWNKFTGWSCNLGVDRFIIGANGRITGSCNAPNVFNFKKQLNVFDPELPNFFSVDHIKPIICKQQRCTCSSEIEVTKHRLERDKTDESDRN